MSSSMKEAQLYGVRSARGDVIFAIFDPESQWVWTERSESAARQVATEKGYQLVEGGEITHTDLLALIGQKPAPPAPAAARPVEPPKPAAPPGPPPSPLPPSVMVIPPVGSEPVTLPKTVYHLDDEPPIPAVTLAPKLPDDDVVIVTKKPGVFQTGKNKPQQESPKQDK
jgi:hypothetical protein